MARKVNIYKNDKQILNRDFKAEMRKDIDTKYVSLEELKVKYSYRGIDKLLAVNNIPVRVYKGCSYISLENFGKLLKIKEQNGANKL